MLSHRKRNLFLRSCYTLQVTAQKKKEKKKKHSQCYLYFTYLPVFPIFSLQKVSKRNKKVRSAFCRKRRGINQSILQLLRKECCYLDGQQAFLFSLFFLQFFLLLLLHSLLFLSSLYSSLCLYRAKLSYHVCDLNLLWNSSESLVRAMEARKKNIYPSSRICLSTQDITSRRWVNTEESVQTYCHGNQDHIYF